MVEISGKVGQIVLSPIEALRTIRIIRQRQDDCRKVDYDDPNYENIRMLNDQLEILKLSIARQIV